MINFLFAILAIIATVPIMIVCIVWSLFMWKTEPFVFWGKIVYDIVDIAKNQ